MTDQYHVLVTGASKGIGQATARHLDRLGYHVLAGVRQPDDADRLRREASSRLTPVLLDVTEPDSIAAAVEQAEAVTGTCGLYGLVNNAGVVIPGPLEFLPLEDFRRQLEVNVTGQIAVTQALLPLIRAGCGRIIMMSSISGLRAVPFVGAYSASKHAMEGLTDALRVELSPWGIHVVSILPGVIDTPLWETTAQMAQRRMNEGALPREAFDLYGEVLQGAEALAGRGAQQGLPPERVAMAVTRALSATTPRTRYFVGQDAHLSRLGNWLLPDRIMDRIVSRMIG